MRQATILGERTQRKGRRRQEARRRPLGRPRADAGNGSDAVVAELIRFVGELGSRLDQEAAPARELVGALGRDFGGRLRRRLLFDRFVFEIARKPVSKHFVQGFFGVVGVLLVLEV